MGDKFPTTLFGYSKGDVDKHVTKVTQELELNISECHQVLANLREQNKQLMREMDKTIDELETVITNEYDFWTMIYKQLEEVEGPKSIIGQQATYKNIHQRRNETREKITELRDKNRLLIDFQDRTIKVSGDFSQEVACTAEYNLENSFSNKTTRSVLIAEDCHDTSSLISHILEREGYRVIIVDNGRAVEDILQNTSNQPDLILMNLKLPYLDGNQLVRRIRGKLRLHNTPILILTSNYIEQEVVNIIQAGANDCIRKPFSPKELLARVDSYCGGAYV